MRCRDDHDRGFTLAEAALALSIVGIAIGLLIPAVLNLRVAMQQQATRTQMDTVLRAIAAFVQANGCVPCPTPAIRLFSAGHGVVRGDGSATVAACGSCTTGVGAVPFKSLGLAESFARDGFGNWLTYAADRTLAASSLAVVPPTSPCQTGDGAPCTATDITNGTRKKGLCQSGLSTSFRISVTIPGFGTPLQAAILLVSHGANQRGAYIQQPVSTSLRKPFPSAVPACSSLGGFERCNADDDTAFTDAVPGNNTGNSSDDPFDDMLLYLDRNALVTYLGGPACQTVW